MSRISTLFDLDPRVLTVKWGSVMLTGTPSFFQRTLGSGRPVGGPQFKTATSPSATSTSLGCTWNSSCSTVRTSGLSSSTINKQNYPVSYEKQHLKRTLNAPSDEDEALNARRLYYTQLHQTRGRV